jgi:hypothetical protein
MPDWWPLLILLGLLLVVAALAWWAVRDLCGFWSGRGSRRGSSGGGVFSGLAEIDRLLRPSIVHVQRVDEESESEQENDGD